MPIRLRMSLLGLGTIALALLLFSVLISALLARATARDRDDILRRRTDQSIAFLAGAAPTELRPQRVPAALDLRTSDDVFVTLLDATGAPLSSTGEVDGAAPTIPAALLAQADADGIAVATAEVAPGVRLRLAARPWSRPDLERGGFAIAGQSIRHVQSQNAGVRAFLVVSGILSLLVAGAAIWFVLGRALRPLKTVARAADEIARTSDLSRRLPPSRHRDEVGLLTTSFNAMMQQLDEAHRRLNESLAAQQRFVADASHELRTPLTSIRTNAAFLERPDTPAADRAAALADIVAESDRMSRLVQDLLTLARADAGQHLPMTPLDLTVIAEHVCRRARTLFPDRRIDVAGDAAVPLCGDPDALTRMLWILVENAARHTPEQGRIRIRPLLRDGDVQVKVVDDGTGIPECDCERIFDRFYQADRARSGDGAGLGLAIARWIASQHGGSLTAANNDSGGATFTFQAPARVPPLLPNA